MSRCFRREVVSEGRSVVVVVFVKEFFETNCAVPLLVHVGEEFLRVIEEGMQAQLPVVLERESLCAFEQVFFLVREQPPGSFE